MKKTQFGGVITALITPFKNNKIDYDALERILIDQINAKIDGILLYGTTGEGLSLTMLEKKSIYIFTRNVIGNKTNLIGCVCNPVTNSACKEVKTFSEWGFDALLCSTPYYYTTLEKGLILHFQTLEKQSDIPLIIYNVPKRTGCDISNYLSLLEYIDNTQKYVGIKHCADNLHAMTSMLKKIKTPLFCGSDIFLQQSLECKYAGAISVISNLFPHKTKQLYTDIKTLKYKDFTGNFEDFYKIINCLNLLPNPIGIKYLMAQKYSFNNELRLPLYPADSNFINLIQNHIKLIFKEK